jgi:hypothetical protein
MFEPLGEIKLLDTVDLAARWQLSRRYVTDKVTKRSDFPTLRLYLSRKVRKRGEPDIEAWEKRQRHR